MEIERGVALVHVAGHGADDFLGRHCGAAQMAHGRGQLYPATCSSGRWEERRRFSDNHSRRQRYLDGVARDYSEAEFRPELPPNSRGRAMYPAFNPCRQSSVRRNELRTDLGHDERSSGRLRGVLARRRRP